MDKRAIIELYREDMKFSAAHFTIFNAAERERLHGHNYYVHTIIEAGYLEPGITYDYSITRHKVLELCRELNEYLLLPKRSPYLKIEQDGVYYKVTFADDVMFFLQKETKLLELENITSEELSHYFLQQLTEDQAWLRAQRIYSVAVKVSTTKGQCAMAKFEVQ